MSKPVFRGSTIIVHVIFVILVRTAASVSSSSQQNVELQMDQPQPAFPLSAPPSTSMFSSGFDSHGSESVVSDRRRPVDVASAKRHVVATAMGRSPKKSSGVNREHSEVPVSGPNVCGSRHSRQCCPGWTKHPGTNRCIVPICVRDCGVGRCMRPNTCLCPGGEIAPSCMDEPDEEPQHDEGDSDQPRCLVRCMNAGTCVGTSCICLAGFQGPYCGQPVCADTCANGGRCIGPNRCMCNYGYSGRRCELEMRTGPCFTQVSDNMCRGQLTGVVCTKALCCATVGAAWGNPCEQCPEQPHPCRRGHMFNERSNQCVDVDECQAIPSLCLAGRCVNSVGSYVCQCDEGQRRNALTNACEDINECATSRTACEHGLCHNTEGSFFCSDCEPGYELSHDRKRCISVELGTCYSEYSQRQCRRPLQQNRQQTRQDCCCVTVGSQSWSDGHNCVQCPTKGSDDHQSLCRRESLAQTAPSDGDVCRHFDHLCQNGRCVATADSYRCDCNNGYRLVNRTLCLDVDECSQSGICLNGRCVNVDGSFRCICNSGYSLSTDGTYCSDTDECEHEGMCPNGVCVNGNGTYVCQCNRGFKSSPNRQICFDIDECMDNDEICLNGRCINTPGSYQCRCNPGYQLSPDGAFCLDINECQKNGICTHGHCINLDGGFKCVCDPGFSLDRDGEICVDIDECETVRDACINGQCVNTQGSYRCECQPGLTHSLDGKTCLDTQKGTCFMTVSHDRCTDSSPVSVTRSTCCCADLEGRGWGQHQPCQACPTQDDPTYRQLCPHGPGMTHDGTDINECAVYSNICRNGACENLEPGFRCVCNPGYETDASGRVCNDLNECVVDRRLCHHGQCRNTAGSFYCVCPTGYRFDEESKECDDIDECRENPCGGINPRCQNSLGSYRCECTVPGTTLDVGGRTCVDNRRGICWMTVNGGNQCEDAVRSDLTRDDCCSTAVGKGWGSPCEPCPEGSSSDSLLHPTEAVGFGPDSGPPIGPNGTCPKGWQPQGGFCIDINECRLFPDICKGDSSCVNTRGSFQCQCPSGLVVDPSGVKCVDRREMVCYARHHRGRCTDEFAGQFLRSICCCSIGAAWGDTCQPCPQPGSDEFRELCPRGSGFAQNSIGPDGFGFVTDVNECTRFPSICSNGRCRNTAGSFVCACNQGYVLSDDGTNCTDVDECRLAANVCGNGTCENLPGRFTCNCFNGFESTMLMQVCMDIDECSRDPSLCRGGHCVNTVGSYTCKCAEGHELMPDSKACKDIDECSLTSGICSNGRCENFMGGYECICDLGYKPNPLRTSCQDIDECRAQNGGCEMSCVNTPGSYECNCRRGYHLLADNRKCEDDDECAMTPDICNGGECFNAPGTYQCRCIEGLAPSPDRKSCYASGTTDGYLQDIDECAAAGHELCHNGRCKNTHGSYVCDCQRGYESTASDMTCADVDECELRSHRCDPHATCTNTEGSYKCECQRGFSGNGFTCNDENECHVRNGGCDQHAACINTEGSFQCVCDDGFQGNGFDCQDIDECSLHEDLCRNGQCTNYAGGYRCECDMGFAPQDHDRICEDIDECREFHNLCINGRCLNEAGSYKCDCNSGYEIDSSDGNCTDVDECENSEVCLYGTCVNQLGGYVCQCPQHFDLNPAGTGCIDRRHGHCYLTIPQRGPCSSLIGQYVSRSTCCCTVGIGWAESSSGDQGCESCPTNGTEQYDALCPGGPGFRPNPVTVILEDVDECTEMTDVCRDGECQNTFGSFICVCPTGFKIDDDRHTCVDIDECSLNSAICGIGSCVNSAGSYTCICPDGHMLTAENNCMDMRPGYCFLRYENRTCDQHLSASLTMKQCCCSLGLGWNAVEDQQRRRPCQVCPRYGTNNFATLCGSRAGQITDPSTGGLVDIDECHLVRDICRNGYCVNTLGSFRCDCPSGFRYDATLHVCEDINECAETRPAACAGNAQCLNMPGSFQCACSTGYKLAPNQRVCQDVDECREIPGLCANGDCINLVGSFNCRCHHGFRLSPRRDTCVDINECRDKPSVCENGVCENTVGLYRCRCNAGFELTHNNDCLDIDECHTLAGVCFNGRCRNTIGSFVCDCHEGYQYVADRMMCEDIDECGDSSRPMCNNGVCTNTPGSFQCHCDTGYELGPSSDECVDVDECRGIAGICRNGQCHNSIGSFTCICPEGFQVSTNGRECRDTRKLTCYDRFVNGRCKQPREMKSSKAQCCCSRGAAWGSEYCEVCPEPQEQSFAVLCPDGYGYAKEFGELVEDINECMVHPDVCKNGRCINTDGSFRCECPPGYTLDSYSVECVDINECSDDNPCGQGHCVNVIGSFECQCAIGYVPGPDGRCEDVNECEEGQHTCAFRCQNVVGSYRCTCPRGYQLSSDRQHCEDVDECRTPANKCRFACKNLIGSFMCICPDGYQQIGTGDDCRDVDECSTVSGICENGDCINTEGGFRCECYSGFRASLDRKRCIDTREGHCYLVLAGGRCLSHDVRLLTTTKSQCCCSSGLAWGSNCEKCPSIGTADHKVMCPMGPGFGSDGMDLDECRFMPNACAHGRCVNTMGSYRCLCDTGYQIDAAGTSCVDVDECSAVATSQTQSSSNRRSGCSHTCRNTDGSFVCVCPNGYSLGSDARTCVDVDECTATHNRTRHNCQQICINTQGSFQCQCRDGYRQSGSRCVDIDECSELSGATCGPAGRCENTPGGYRCSCRPGFKVDESGRYCIDVDECSTQNTNGYGRRGGEESDDGSGRCQYGCINLVGGFRCECPVGFVHYLYWNQCIDDNECMQPGVCGAASCQNRVGGYNCMCGFGSVFDPNSMSCVGVGGRGCGGAPCNFGCTPTSSGFICGCPDGFKRIGHGHCVSAQSPQGSRYQTAKDGEYHHVSGSSGYQLPPGEGCYACNLDSDDIPLQRKLTSPSATAASNAGGGGNRRRGSSSRRRYRRASDLQLDGGPIVIDVSGPHPIPPPPSQYDNDVASTDQPSSPVQDPLLNVTVFRLDDLISADVEIGRSTLAFYDVTTAAATTASATTPQTTAFGTDDDDVLSAGAVDDMLSDVAELLPTSEPAVQDLRPDRPVVVYLSRREVRPGIVLLNVVPTLSALTGKETCDVTQSDVEINSSKWQPKFKVVTSMLGVSSVQFASDDDVDYEKPPLSIKAGLYRLRLECRANISAELENVVSDASSRQDEKTSELFALDIELHVY